jgi:hypothetical protein
MSRVEIEWGGKTFKFESEADACAAGFNIPATHPDDSSSRMGDRIDWGGYIVPRRSLGLDGEKGES